MLTRGRTRLFPLPSGSMAGSAEHGVSSTRSPIATLVSGRDQYLNMTDEARPIDERLAEA